jgi:quinol-cytochrome oxidoreductase complex cytochrome b subunit
MAANPHENLFIAYPLVGLIVAVVLAVTGKLGDGTPLSGKGGAFVMAVWLWPIVLIAVIVDHIASRKKR